MITAGTISSNTIVVDHLHTNAVDSTLAVLSSCFTQNWVKFGGLSVDEGASGVTGIVSQVFRPKCITLQCCRKASQFTPDVGSRSPMHRPEQVVNGSYNKLQ